MSQFGANLPADWRETPLARVLSPMQHFIRSETAGGLVLIGATFLALALANSPLREAYTTVLETHIGFSVGAFSIDESVLHWINDGLMALFFFVVGLELKREALVGELANPRQAILPLVAAVGGAIVPAVLYSLLNRGGVGSAGWGIPMATDIAFALGVLALLGDRVPWSLKVFLTAVAVIDDLLAVLVIALFYTSEIQLGALGVGAGVLVLLVALNFLGIRAAVAYAVLGSIVWLAFLESGVHATIAGVLVALTIPARNRIDWPHFLLRARNLLGACEPVVEDGSQRILTDERQQSAVYELEELCESVQAPLQRLEHGLHPWVSFGIVPIFALANAGVSLSTAALAGEGLLISMGIVLGLVVGKPIGLILAAWLAVWLKVATLPSGVSWSHVIGAGCLAGLGFTMSLFIATLAFDDVALLEAAKLGILAASVVAGVVGAIVLARSRA
jgi:Na+:H+ antiporter, NhaA family